MHGRAKSAADGMRISVRWLSMVFILTIGAAFSAIPVQAVEASADAKTLCFEGSRPYRIGMQICPSPGLRLLCLGPRQRYPMAKIHRYSSRRDGTLRFDKAHWVEFAVAPTICPAHNDRPIWFT